MGSTLYRASAGARRAGSAQRWHAAYAASAGLGAGPESELGQNARVLSCGDTCRLVPLQAARRQVGTHVSTHVSTHGRTHGLHVRRSGLVAKGQAGDVAADDGLPTVAWRCGGVGCDGYNTLRRACMLVRAHACLAAREDLNTARGGDLKLTTLGLLLPQLRDWGAWLLLGGFLAWRVRGCVHKVTISRSASLSGGNSGVTCIRPSTEGRAQEAFRSPQPRRYLAVTSLPGV